MDRLLTYVCQSSLFNQVGKVNVWELFFITDNVNSKQHSIRHAPFPHNIQKHWHH